MEDLTKGRINCNNITDEEWEFIDKSYIRGWFVPSDNEWLKVRDLLGLFEIRRGFSIKLDNDKPFIQGGTAQIRLNEHGQSAMELYFDTGRYYQSGKPSTFENFEPYMTEDELDLFD